MTGVGARGQLRWGFEESGGAAAYGLAAPTWYGLRVANFKCGPDPVYDTRSNLEPRAQQLRDDIVGYNLPIEFAANLSEDDLARLAFHLQGYAAITNPAAGVYDWTYRDLLSTDSLTVDPSRISLEGDVDDGYAGLVTNAALDMIECKVSKGKIVDWKFNGVACRYTNLRDVEAVVGPATFTGTIYVRGLRHDTDAEDTTNDLKFKCTTAGGSGVGKIKFTKGATAYGSVEYTVTYGTIAAPVWMDVILADGTHASGDQLNPVQIAFVGTGNLVAGGTPDEWKIRAQRVKGVATYPARNPFKSGRCVITAGGATKDVDEFTIVMRRARHLRGSTASMWPIGLTDDVAREFSIRMKREYVDRYFNLKRLSGTPIAFDATLNGDLIATVASASYYAKAQFTSANAQVKKGGVSGVPNGQQLQEDIEIEPFWDGSIVDMTQVIRCSLSTLK